MYKNKNFYWLLNNLNDILTVALEICCIGDVYLNKIVYNKVHNNKSHTFFLKSFCQCCLQTVFIPLCHIPFLSKSIY